METWQLTAYSAFGRIYADLRTLQLTETGREYKRVAYLDQQLPSWWDDMTTRDQAWNILQWLQETLLEV